MSYTVEPKLDEESIGTTGGFPLRLCEQFEQAGIAYCVLRGGDQLDRQAGGEVDLLVPPAELSRLHRLLNRLGFVHLRAWGHAPHHFFVGYDAAADSWLKLDVVTQIHYGRPTHSLATPLAAEVLKNRRRCGSVYVPSAEDELVLLLLHCVVDRGDFPETWCRRMAVLCEQVTDEAYLDDLLSRYVSQYSDHAPRDDIRTVPGADRQSAFLTRSVKATLTGCQLKSLVSEGRLFELAAARPAVKQHLAARQRVSRLVRTVRDHGLRKLLRLVRRFVPDAISVAILAPDGAGKSTLAEGLSNGFFFPVEQIYMGLYAKQPGTAPQRRRAGLGLPGKLLTQWRRYLRAHLHRSRGRFVIFDRYTYDALLPAPYRLSAWQRIRRWMLAHACPAPQLIVVLDAPGEVLFARKGEHSAEHLEGQRQAYRQLQSRFPQLVVVDATLGAEQVRREVTGHIWRRYAARLGDSFPIAIAESPASRIDSVPSATELSV